jgi:hypothetical protein
MSGRPAGLLTGSVGVGCGLVAFALAAVGTPTVAAGSVGVLALAAGHVHRSRRLADAGAAALFVQLVVATVGGLGPTTALAAAVALVLAWTFAHSAVDLRATLGTAPSGDLELAHLAGTTGIALVAAVAAVLTFGVSLGDLPPAVALAVLFGAIGLTAALRR